MMNTNDGIRSKLDMAMELLEKELITIDDYEYVKKCIMRHDECEYLVKI